MKPKKMLLMMVAVCSIVALLSVNAHAAWVWHTCTVNDAGISGTVVYAGLTDDAHNWPDGRRFSVYAQGKKEMLATLLTAMNMGVKCLVYMDADASSPYVKGVIMLTEPAP